MEKLTGKDSYCSFTYCDNEGKCKIENVCYDKKLYDKLKEYEDLEEQGRLIELPCKVGDEFWVVAYCDKTMICVRCTGYTIQVDTVNMINHAYLWINSVDELMDYWKLTFDEFYKRCFKTKEEAEKALEMGK